MKKIYSLLAASFLAVSSFAQTASYDLAVQLISPVSMGFAANAPAQTIEFAIGNVGTDAVPAGDEMYVTIYNYTEDAIYGFDMSSNNVAVYPLDSPFLANSYFTDEVTLDFSNFTVGDTVGVWIVGSLVATADDATFNALFEGDDRDEDYSNNFAFFKIGTLGAEKIEMNDFIVAYPVPARATLNFSTEKEIASIEVLSLDGKVVATSSNAKSVEVKDLAEGAYIYNVTTVDGAVTSKKFIKK